MKKRDLLRRIEGLEHSATAHFVRLKYLEELVDKLAGPTFGVIPDPVPNATTSPHPTWNGEYSCTIAGKCGVCGNIADHVHVTP